MRLSYRWKEIYGTYLLSSSADQLFQTLFKALVRQQHSAEFVAILQELARVGCSSSSPLLETLQTLLSDSRSVSLAASSMTLAVSLPPSTLFCGCKDGDVTVVGSFVQQTLAPLVQTMMALPFHITHYLLQGVSSVAGGGAKQLCELSPFFLASLLVHWPLFPNKPPCPCEVIATASWIHSGMQGPLPVFVCSGLLAPLSVAVWHKLTQQDDTASLHLAHLPIHVVVFVAVCCVHWLASNPHPHPLLSTVETLLEACVELEPTAMEVFLSDQSEVPEFVKLNHLQMLAEFRGTFSCTPSSSYPVLLLKLAGRLSAPVLKSTLTATTCFLWLCVKAYGQCVSLSTPLPNIPPLAYQPFSVLFIGETKSTLVALVEQADPSQLQNVLEQCPAELKPILISKLNSPEMQ